MHYPAFTLVELSGHILDSLTLAKVIDKIQLSGCQYQIPDIQIGHDKTDLSSVQIALWAKHIADLNRLVEELKVYGAHPVSHAGVQTAPAPDDGVLPPDDTAHIRPHLKLFHEGTWIPVDASAVDLAVTLNPHTRQARLIPASAVKKGEQVIVGRTGVKLLPHADESLK